MRSRREQRASELRCITDAKALMGHTYDKCRNGKVFPKKDRGGLPSRMMDEADEALACMMDANGLDLRSSKEGAERLRQQRRAMRQLGLLEAHIELAHDKHHINDDAFAYWAGLAERAKMGCAGWHKSDKGRYLSLHR